MITRPVYQPPERVRLVPDRPLPDKYFDYTPDELEQEYMRYAMQLIDTQDHCPSLPEGIRANDIAFYQRQMDLIDQRIRRYRPDRRLKYSWPDRKKYEALGELAQDIKRRYPMERFIQDHVPACDLRQNGGTWLGRCPIPTHQDSTPSFHVYDSIRFKCFGCGASGDVLDLIGLVYGIEAFTDRVHYLTEVLA